MNFQILVVQNVNQNNNLISNNVGGVNNNNNNNLNGGGGGPGAPLTPYRRNLTHAKPPYSYISLITMAIQNNSSKITQEFLNVAKVVKFRLIWSH